MKNIIIFALLFFAVIPCLGTQKHAALLETAENNFITENYRKTIEIYEILIQVEKVNDPYVHYNLSNAYYRNGELGKAAVNIEKAFLLNPHDKDIRHNKKFLNIKAGERVEGFDKLLNFVASVASLNEVTVIFSAIAVFVLLFGSLYLLKRKRIFKNVVSVLLIFLVLAAILLAVKVKKEILNIAAVALSSIPVRSGPGINNPEIFNLPKGRKVLMSRENGDWSHIKIYPEGFVGWIESGEIEKING